MQLNRPEAKRLTGEAVSQVSWLRGDPPGKFYPAEAKRAGLDGSAIVDLLINAEGFVVEAQVISESPAGHGFGLAALDAVKTYEFDNRLKQLVLMLLTIEFLP
jgi:TonB family protein